MIFMKRKFAFIIFLFFISVGAIAQHVNKDSAFIADNFIKIERMIPMRDGVRLFTSIYIPKDENEKYPFLVERTPYSCSPYGTKMRLGLGPSNVLEREKYISVTKSFKDRKPNTKYKATERGRAAFKRHLDGLEQVIRQQKK